MAGKYSHEQWLALAQEKHPEFDYTQSIYVDSYHKVVIKCIKHNRSFETDPLKLLTSEINNCPECKNKSFFGNKTLPKINENHNIFYKLKVTHKQSRIEFIKIGTSSTPVSEIYKEYNDFEFEVLEEIYTDSKKATALKKEYANNNKRFFLPKELFDSTDLYEPDGYHQLLHSQVQFIRNSILEKQEGICPLCNNEVFMPTLDHYHSKKQYGSGLVRGVICNTCNRMLGVIENNLLRNSIPYSDAPKILINISDYLLNSRTRYIHPTEKPKSPKLMKSSYNKLVKAIGGKQKIPKFNGKLSKKLEVLFSKYSIQPSFH